MHNNTDIINSVIVLWGQTLLQVRITVKHVVAFCCFPVNHLLSLPLLLLLEQLWLILPLLFLWSHIVTTSEWLFF